MTDQAVESLDEFLKHMGVRGMHWGVRKTNDGSVSRQKMSKKKKVAIGVGIGAIAVGAAVGVAFLNKNGNLPISKIPSPTKVVTATQTADRIFNGVNFSELERSLAKMTMEDVHAKAAQYWNSDEGRAILALRNK